MRRLVIIILILLTLPVSVNAMEFTAPEAPIEAEKYMPEESGSFGEDLWHVIKSGIADLQPSVVSAVRICLSLVAITVLISMLQTMSGTAKNVVHLSGTISIGLMLIEPSNALVELGVQTIEELNEYGKLLLPVMTAAMAAQGGVSTASSLYTVAAFFNTLLTTAITKLLVPILYIYIVLSVANNAIGNDIIQRLQKAVNNLMVWGLKAALYLFSGFITITGVVSGAADASAVKAARLVISGTVPVVGKIISDASETILVSAGIMKNAVGIYGIIAIAAILIGPFLRIGVQYLILKMTAAICSVFDAGKPTALIRDFSGMMGFLLAATGTVCLLLLISTVCFMKGIA